MTGDATEGGTFAQALAALKRRGATVLVRGGASADDPVCTSLLGDDAAGRRRLLLEPAGGPRRVAGPAGEDALRVTLPAVGRRSAAAMATSSAAGGAAARPSDPTPGELVRLASAVREAVETLGGDDLAAGQLRVCGGDLDPLVEGFGTAAVRRYLHLVATRVVDVGGLAHFHLPVGAAAEPSLGPLFDVHVDVRRRLDGEREQRWRLRESGLETGWLPLVVE